MSRPVLGVPKTRSRPVDPQKQYVSFLEIYTARFPCVFLHHLDNGDDDDDDDGNDDDEDICVWGACV